MSPVRTNAHLEEIASHFDGVRPNGTGLKAHCPCHDDSQQSLHISIGDKGGIVIKCFANCNTADILDRRGLTFKDLAPRDAWRSANGHGERFTLTAYDYVDEDGALLYQTVRKQYPGRKDFYQRKPQRGGGWENRLGDVRRVLFRLPELIAALSRSETICVFEGEKDVNRAIALGIPATTNAMGAGKWRPEYTAQLAGATVALLPDNDEPGYKHVRNVAISLTDAGATVMIVRFTDLGEKGDFSDYADVVGDRAAAANIGAILRRETQSAPGLAVITMSELAELCGPVNARAFIHDADESDTRQRIDAGDQDLERVSALAWEAIQRANASARLFRFGGLPVRIDGLEDDHPVAQSITPDILSYEAARAAQWFKETKEVRRPASPPMRVLRDMLAYQPIPLPALLGIVRTPVFAPDGALHDQPGYHEGSKTYYAPAPGFAVPPVSQEPTADELQRALDLILEDLLGDFPFTGEAERANAVALFLDPYVRNLINGPTPLRLIEAPTPGSGKGLLADAALRPAIGRQTNVMPAANDDDEWRKRISAQMMLGPVAIQIDNVTSALDSGSLSAALTAEWWTDRRLGANEMIRVPVRCIWVATANNPTLSTELARRSVRIRLDPKVDRPWQRQGFRHEDLRQWIDGNRGALVWAALTIVRHWISEGQPLGTQKLGSFERWSHVLGGILGAAGIEGFLGNLEVFYEAADLEGAIWRQFVAQWAEEHGTEEVGVADLFTLAQQNEGLDLGNGSERSQRVSFGLALNQQRDRVIGDYRIVNTRTVKRLKKWRLLQVHDPFAAAYQDSAEQPAADEEEGWDQWTR